MTDNDKDLLRIARQTNYKEFRSIYHLIGIADADITKQKLKNIIEILSEICQDRA